MVRVLLIDNTKADKVHFTRLLETRLTELLGVDNVVRCSTIDDVIDEIEGPGCGVDAAILSGSTLNLSEPNRIAYMRKSLSALLRLTDIPILGICFGMQLISMAYGGVLDRSTDAFRSEVTLDIKPGSVLFHGAARRHPVTLSHQDVVVRAPRDFAVLAEHRNCLQVVESTRFLRFGVQFHPEKRARGCTVCVLANFCRFVLERKTLPRELAYVDEVERIRFVLRLGQTQSLRAAMEGLAIDDKDLLMALWRHHMVVWGMRPVLV